MSERRGEACSAWADETLHDLARLVFHAFQRALERATVTHGVSPAQWRCLRQLWHGNGVCQRRLAARLAISEASTTVTLGELERKGLIDRRRNTANRREMLIFLTARGRALEHALLPVARDIHIRATRDMPSTDIMELERLLRGVIANLGSP